MNGGEDDDPRFVVLADPEAGPAGTAAEVRYGGPLRFPDGQRPHVVANFVSTIDGVATLGLVDGTDSSTISARSAPDRYLMAMLRAACDAVVVGARTLRTTPRHQWTACFLFRELCGELEDLRRAGGRAAPAPLVIVTASGALPDHVALREPAVKVVVITTGRGARAAASAAPTADVVVASETQEITGDALLAALDATLHAPRVLCEGGPRLLGTLLGAGALHDLFLTVSPRIAGRVAGDGRSGIVEGWAAAPPRLVGARIHSARRSGDHLFLRYSLAS